MLFQHSAVPTTATQFGPGKQKQVQHDADSTGTAGTAGTAGHEPTHLVARTPRRRGDSRRRSAALASVALTAVAALGLAIPSPASAAVSSGGGYGGTTVACSATMHSATLTVHMMPQSGYASQYAAVRFMASLDGGRTWVTGRWNYMTATDTVPYVMPFSTANGLNVRYYVQYTWWRGSAWSPVVGEYITRYQQIGLTSDYQYTSTTCTV
jgi:hypothetical protein